MEIGEEKMKYTETQIKRLTAAVQEAVIRDPLMKEEYEEALAYIVEEITVEEQDRPYTYQDQQLAIITNAINEAIEQDDYGLTDDYEEALKCITSIVEDKIDYHYELEAMKNKLYLQGYKVAHLRKALTEALEVVEEVIEDYDGYLDSKVCKCNRKAPTI